MENDGDEGDEGDDNNKQKWRILPDAHLKIKIKEKKTNNIYVFLYVKSSV